MDRGKQDPTSQSDGARERHGQNVEQAGRCEPAAGQAENLQKRPRSQGQLKRIEKQARRAGASNIDTSLT